MLSENLAKHTLNFNGIFHFINETFTVRPIQNNDIETLRTWRNSCRKFFFHNKAISTKEQIEWFSKFSKDLTQEIYMCEINGHIIACVGFRITAPNEVELFNLICADEKYQRTGLTTRFYQFLELKLKEKKFCTICLRVLKTNNAAKAWYLKQKYNIVKEDQQSFFMNRKIEEKS